MEQLDLTTPITVTIPTITYYKLDDLRFEWTEKRIRLVFIAPAPAQPVTKHIEGDEARTLMIALNKANLSVKSLNKRIMEYAATKWPELAGTVSGTVD